MSEGKSGKALVTQSQTIQVQTDRELGALMEKVLVTGDLLQLSPKERTQYYLTTCESIGLNPYTKPFEYLLLPAPGGGKKLVLYALKNCTDQLRMIHGVSVKIVGRGRDGEIYIVTAKATMPSGREDESIGAVTVGHLKGDPLCNAVMKAETKAKRRATLSLCGLSFIDESEVATIAGAKIVSREEAESEGWQPPDLEKGNAQKPPPEKPPAPGWKVSELSADDSHRVAELMEKSGWQRVDGLQFMIDKFNVSDFRDLTRNQFTVMCNFIEENPKGTPPVPPTERLPFERQDGVTF